MIHADVPSFSPLGLEDGHVATFSLLLKRTSTQRKTNLEPEKEGLSIATVLFKGPVSRLVPEDQMTSKGFIALYGPSTMLGLK